MFYSISTIWAILIPVIMVQYVLTIFCLIKLVLMELPKKKMFIWNFFILLAVGIGVITFLICYFLFRKKVFPDAKFYKEDNVEGK